MPESLIVYFGQRAKVACDGNCAKAWGRSQRPTRDGEDDYVPDAELGIAPVDPGTYEGEDSKPLSVTQFPNKWCVRECERCVMSRPGEWNLPVKIPEFK